MKREECLKMHTYKIWRAKDGFCKTKVKGDDGKYILIKRKTQSGIEDVLTEWYATHSLDNSFKARFDAWVDRQRICGRSNNTIYKYQTDYNRFFAGYPFEQLDIRDINDETISEHILKVLSEKEIRWRALKDIFGYINGVFEKSIRDKLITDNPCKYIDLPIYRTKCYTAPVKTRRERTLSDAEIASLFESLWNPKAKNVNKIACFAIELALYTGMRVGEIAALMWDDIDAEEGYMVIQHSEKKDRIDNTIYISITKTGKERIFPITAEIDNLLMRIREYESAQGWLGEYVFQDKNGRLSGSKITDAMRNKTMTEAFNKPKSIHSIRRTFNSKLKCGGVPTTTASALLGHTDRVNDANYTYDILNLKSKHDIVEAVNFSLKSNLQSNPK